MVNFLGTGLSAVLYYVFYTFAPSDTPIDVYLWFSDPNAWSLLPAFNSGFCGTTTPTQPFPPNLTFLSSSLKVGQQQCRRL